MRPCLRCVFLLALSIGGASSASAQSYEGYLTSERDGRRVPIWVDLRGGTGTALSGTYFYKRVGTPLSLTGSRNGVTLSLEERGANGRVTGRFALTDFRDSVTGVWSAPSGGARFRVWIVPVDSSYRRLARVPSADRVRLRDGRTLREHHQEASADPIAVTFHRGGIVVYEYSVTYVGAYATTDRYSHAFDVQANREIDLKAELRPDRSDRFWARVGTQLRQEFAAWTQEMEARPEDERLDAETIQILRESVDQNAEAADRYSWELTDRGLEVTTVFDDNIPHSARALAFGFTLRIPYAELGPSLRAGSPLARLVPP